MKKAGKELIVTKRLLSVSMRQVQQAMGMVMSPTEAAASKVHDQEQRQIQLTTSHCSCPPGSDSSAFGTFALSQLVLEAASSSMTARA